MTSRFLTIFVSCSLALSLGGCAHIHIAADASSTRIAGAAVAAEPERHEPIITAAPRTAIHAWKLLAWPMQSQSIRMDAPIDKSRMAFLEKTLSPFDNIDERPSIGLIIATLEANEDSESMRCQFEAYGLGARRNPEQAALYLKLRQEVGKSCRGVAGYPSDAELDKLDAKAGVAAAQAGTQAKKSK